MVLIPRWIVALHRNLTTFQKIVIANSAIIAFGAVLGPLITLELGGTERPLAILLFVGLGLATSLTANFVILRLAFKPLRDLEGTMANIHSTSAASQPPST
jgi:two-component system, NarL family, sensor histidine kinase UhpB